MAEKKEVPIIADDVYAGMVIIPNNHIITVTVASDQKYKENLYEILL